MTTNPLPNVFFNVFWLPQAGARIEFSSNGGREVGECFDGYIVIAYLWLNLCIFDMNKLVSAVIKALG